MFKFVGSFRPVIKRLSWSFATGIRKKMLLYAVQRRNFAEETSGPSKKDGKIEEIEKLKMPGFIHPQHCNEEGYFTQKAKQQLEELKKKMDKPHPDNKEKRE